MAQRHWLDPLARQLLIATGQLPAPPRPAGPDPATPVAAAAAPPMGSSAAVARPAPLRSWWQRRSDAGSGAVDVAAAAALQANPEDPQEAIERDLLALQLAQQPGRPLRDADEVRRAAALGWQLDVNRATAADWLRLPGCGPDQADLLQRLQAGGVQLSGPEDLQRLLQLEPVLVQSWLPLLVFRWYGTPPLVVAEAIAINRAPAASLRRLEGLEEALLEQILLARRQRPFRDLADLQQRLELPAALIEAWIGRLSFDPPPPGPRLPPAARRL